MVGYIKLKQVLKKTSYYLILKKKVISNTKEIKMNHKSTPSKSRQKEEKEQRTNETGRKETRWWI